MKLKYLALPFIALIVSASVLNIMPQQAKAVSAADWKAGRIIDDSVFFNKDSMSVQQIQDFLNAKVPSCDRWNPTRFTYAGKPYGPPYTCLKEYQENPTTKENNIGRFNPDGSPYNVPGGWSAAQIIKDASNSYGINPQVLLVLLQKETAIVTDTWAAGWQYDRAMGYGCPDSGPNNTANCNASYYGFYNQVGNAAWQLKNPVYGSFGITKNIMWQVGNVCGSSPVYIENFATASLYSYTPYQPNQAALNNLYGTGDGCSAYGNRNFWRIFNDWFGSSIIPGFSWRVIKSPSDSKLFLQVANTKRWISTGQLYTDWKLNNYPTITLSQNEFDSIPTIPELSRLGTSGNYKYLIEGGRRHYIQDKYISLWGMENTIPAPVDSLVATIPEYEPIGRFIKQSNGNIYLVNKGKLSGISLIDAAAWGYSNNDVVGISDSLLSSMPTSVAVSRHIEFNGSKYIVDQARLLKMPDEVTAFSWQSSPYVSIDANAPLFLPVNSNVSNFVRAANSPQWYMLNQAKKHYVPNSNIAYTWGMNDKDLVSISPELLSSFIEDQSLTSFIKDSSDQKVYYLDGSKHHVLSGQLLSTIKADSVGIIEISSQRSSQIPTGQPYSNPVIQITGTPHTYLLDNGNKYHFSTGSLVAAYSSWGSPHQINRIFTDQLTYKNNLSSIVKDSTNQTLLIDSGKKNIINNAYINSWSKENTTTLSDNILSLIPDAGAFIQTNYIQHNGSTYFMNAGTKTKINPSLLNSYNIPDDRFNLQNDTIQTNLGLANFFIRNTEDGKVWFINNGTKAEYNFAAQVSYGYLSSNSNIVNGNSNILNLFTTSDNTKPLLIRKNNSWGIKFVNFGRSLGFPDGDTLNAYSNSQIGNILTVDDWIYDQFPLNGNITRLIRDDSGKIYYIENGKARWITNGAAYARYSGIPVTYLYGTTMALIPMGTNID